MSATETKKVTKKHAEHPTYAAMIAAAIAALKDRTGSSRQAIFKYICANYKVDADKAGTHVRLALKAGVKKGTFKMAKETGKGAGSFKLVEKPKAEKKDKKPAATKPKAEKKTTKAAGEKKIKKPVTKKPKGEKKAAVKKPKATKKPAAEKKKPAAKKPKAIKQPVAAKKPVAKKPKAAAKK